MVRVSRFESSRIATREYQPGRLEKDTLKDNLEAVLEKEVQGFIKLASWKDVNIHALRQSAQKTHRQLYKVVRKLRDVLRQPVLPLLQPVANTAALSEQVVDNPLATSAMTTLPEAVTFPYVQPPPNYPPHLVNLSVTYKNYTSAIIHRLGVSFKAHQPQSVEDLAEDIILTSNELANVAIPNNLDPARKAKLHKNLLTRKRKAWSDLLKALKNAGLAANVKPEILAQNRSQRWVREQPIMRVNFRNVEVVNKAEQYFNRLCGVLPILRGALSDHHEDIGTRELQRALMHIESCFSLAVRSRLRYNTFLFQSLHTHCFGQSSAEPEVPGKTGPLL